MNKLPEEAAFSPQGVVSGFEEAAMKDDVAGLIAEFREHTSYEHEASYGNIFERGADALTTLSARVETLEAENANLVASGRSVPWGSPPEPVVNPSADWLDAYANWFYQGKP